MFAINAPADVMTDNLSGEKVDVTLGGFADINVEVLTGVNANVSVAVMIMLSL